MAHGGGQRFGGVGFVRLGGWGWNAGEIPVGFGPDAVTPVGATIPSWRVSVVFTPHLPPRAGGNPRTRPGSSVVGVAFLLGGAAWYAEVRNLGLWWFLSGGRRGGGSSVLCRAAVADICFFFLFFWCVVLLATAISVLSVGCFGLQSAGKPFFGRDQINACNQELCMS